MQNNKRSCLPKLIKMIFFTVMMTIIKTSQILEEQSLGLTIYNNDFAMVRDVRQIRFDKSQSELFFTDVAAKIQTETVTFKVLDNPGSVRVHQQNFQENLVTTEGILNKYINQNVTVYANYAQKNKAVNGILLGHTDGIILQTSQGVEILQDIAGLKFHSLPLGFYTKPTLRWIVNSDKAQTRVCQVAYRTTGLGWHASYSLTVNEKETKADFGGWVTIDNDSGKRYDNCSLKLIAGDVNVESQQDMLEYEIEQDVEESAAFQQQTFSDYHLYKLGRLVNVTQNSQKQIEFIPTVNQVKIDKFNYIQLSAGGYSQDKLTVQNKISLRNSKKNGLGMALPKGTVRVFKGDKDGSLEFIGEDSIDHTPRDEDVNLTIGNAFDITGKLVSLQKTNFDRGYDATMKLVVKNHKDVSAKIVVDFTNYYNDDLVFGWEGDVDLQRINSGEFKWSKVMGPDSEWAVSWTEKYRY